MRRLARGEDVPPRDPRLVYGGAHGLPIREQVIARTGREVITRNSYGARCLNVPDVLFADIDGDRPRLAGCLPVLALVLVTAAAAIQAAAGRSVLWGALAGTALLALLVTQTVRRSTQETPARLLQHLRDFADADPRCRLAVDQTPAGLRVLALHQTFDPVSRQTQALLRALHTDPIYTRMCAFQACFRARVSGKPWRMEIAEHIRPRGVWPCTRRAPARARGLGRALRAGREPLRRLPVPDRARTGAGGAALCPGPARARRALPGPRRSPDRLSCPRPGLVACVWGPRETTTRGMRPRPWLPDLLSPHAMDQSGGNGGGRGAVFLAPPHRDHYPAPHDRPRRCCPRPAPGRLLAARRRTSLRRDRHEPTPNARILRRDPDRDLRSRLLLVRRGRVRAHRGRRRRRVGLHGRHGRAADLRAGLHRNDGARRGRAGPVRPDPGAVRGAARHVLPAPRPDDAKPPGQRPRHAIPVGGLLPRRRTARAGARGDREVAAQGPGTRS